MFGAGKPSPIVVALVILGILAIVVWLFFG
jgi:hypothetical protein